MIRAILAKRKLVSVLLFMLGIGILTLQWPGVFVIAASAASLSGVVKVDSSKALRGARITVDSGQESVSRFSDQGGRFKIEGLKPGSYKVTASAWGFEEKSENLELTKDVESNFTLAPHWNVDRLSTADWLSFLPQNDETLTLKATCVRCHNLSYMVRNRGLLKPQWANIIQYMMQMRPTITEFKMSYPGESASRIGSILEKYLGPNSSLPTQEQVQHRDISDAALRATYREYKPLTQAHIHSVLPDPQGKYVWFSYFIFGGTVPEAKFGRFEIATGEMQDFQPPIGETFSTMTVSKDGKNLWFTGDGKLNKMNVLSSEYSEFAPPHDIVIPAGSGRTMPKGEDSAGNIWLVGTTIVKFDPRTEQFEEFEIPKVSLTPEEHQRSLGMNLGNTRKEDQTEFSSIAYGLAVDSKDNIWYNSYDVGYIARLNPKTKETKMYRVPNDAIMIKAITVGPDDMVWFSCFARGTLFKLDPDTGKIEEYQPPNPHAAIYTAVVDSKGDVWLSDFAGSQMTRFNPATKEFTEYPLPAADGMVRFFGLDPQDRVWYVDFETGIIGVLDPGDV